jgi:methionyl aminopeptidase
MNKRYKQHFLHAGALANQVRAYGKSLIKKEASYKDVIAKINQKIIELGARAAFPPQIALNDVAAHFLVQPDEDIIFSDQIIKLDIGVCYEGAIGDCAVTIDLSGKYQKLVEAVESALLNAEQSIKVGQKVREIGKIIDETIASYGFNSIKNLSGHGLALYQIHTTPPIPNYDNQSTAIIRPGMTFAIEPFATTGKGLIYESGVPTIFSFKTSRPVKSDVERLLLTKIKNFKGLPFAIHDLIDEKSPFLDVKKGLLELLRAGIIVGYAPLIEEMHGVVAQAENSVLVDEKGEIFITTR